MKIYEAYACDDWRSNITLNSRIMATTNIEDLAYYLYEHIDEYCDNVPNEAKENVFTLFDAVKNQRVENIHLNIVEDGEVTN